MAVHFVLHLPRTDHSHWREKLAKVDFSGAFTLVSAVFCLLLGLDNGSNVGWRELRTIVPLAVSPLLFGLFLLIEVNLATHPFAPGHIIFQRSLFASFMTNFFGVAGQMPTVFFLPLLYQAAEGLSTVQSGMLLIPGSIAGVSASLGGGYIIRRTGRFYWITVASYGLLLLSTIPMILFSGVVVLSTAGTVTAWVLISLGAGSGTLTSPVGEVTKSLLTFARYHNVAGVPHIEC
jgi:hypothetical protein